MGPVPALVRMRLATVRNRLLDLRGDAAVKGAVVAVGILLISGLAYGVSYFCFRFIEGFPAIGAPLNERILGLFFLVLLVMVALSTAVIAYSTLFLAAETEFLFQQPLPPRVIFFAKLGESVAFSAWATLILGLPVLWTFGAIRRAQPLYYLEASLGLVVFLCFCGCVGAALTLLLLEVVKRWTWRRLALVALALVGLPAWLFLRSFDFGALDGEQNLQVLDRFAAGLSALSSPFFPGHWTAALVVSAAGGHHREALFQGAVLLSNTLIFLPLFSLYGVRRYGQRWLEARGGSGIGPLETPAPVRARKRPRALNGPFRALAHKDLLNFVRDPAQLTQFILFTLLLLVYVISLLQIPRDLFGEGWRVVLYFANLGAVSLILSSFTSRFVFPLLSLEGKCFWMVGLAPIDRAYLIRQKTLLGGSVILTLGVAATLASNLFLGFRGPALFSGLYTVLLVGICLTTLASGLGAAYPSLGEDNPARIAVGLGGTLNFFASAGVVVLVLGIQAVPHLLPAASRTLAGPLAHLLALAAGAAVSLYALRLGRRALRSMEF